MKLTLKRRGRQDTLRSIRAAIPVIVPLAVAAAVPRGAAPQAATVPHAAGDPSVRAHLFAGLPDWTGIWETEAAAALEAGMDPATPKLWDKPPYSSAAQKKYAPNGFPLAGAKSFFAALTGVQATGKLCQPLGFPGVMEVPVPDYLFELLVTPEQTLLIAADGTLRHIYTDGRPHPKPEDLWPTPTGDSIGYWKGDTLVIDTIAREPGPIAPSPGIANLSQAAHFSERLRRINADTLEDAMTIEDPLRFTHPWQVTIRYARVKNLDRMIPTGCEHDRNPLVNGELIVAPPPQ